MFSLQNGRRQLHAFFLIFFICAGNYCLQFLYLTPFLFQIFLQKADDPFRIKILGFWFSSKRTLKMTIDVPHQLAFSLNDYVIFCLKLFFIIVCIGSILFNIAVEADYLSFELEIFIFCFFYALGKILVLSFPNLLLMVGIAY